jgi:hypothetical protein
MNERSTKERNNGKIVYEEKERTRGTWWRRDLVSRTQEI